MQCINCQTDNPAHAKKCVTCLAPLGRRRQSDYYQTRKKLLVLAMVCFWLGTFGYFFRDALWTEKKPTISPTTAAELQAKKKQKLVSLWEAGKKQRQADGRATAPESGAGPGLVAMPLPAATPAAKPASKEVITGWVIIVSPWAQQIAKVRSAVVEDGWLALPARACLGANRWYFQADRGGSGELDGGRWQAGDVAGLWHIGRGGMPLTGPALQAWQKGESVRWISLETEGDPQEVMLQPIDQQGLFVRATLAEVPREAGFFVQNGAVVGWTFGAWSDSAWMWGERAAGEAKVELAVVDFYEKTFANGREERFGQALALGADHSPLARLEAIVDGFRRAPKLALEDTPYPFLPSVVLKTMRLLVAQASEQGGGPAMVELFSPELFLTMADPDLFLDLLPQLLKSKGFEYTAGLIEKTGSQLVRQSGREKPALNEFHLQLYRDWLATLIAAADKAGGWQVLNLGKSYYNDDAYLHLMQVELVLMDGDWATGEQLLNQRSYPVPLLDKRERLAAKIAELKGQAGKIVVNFPPGSSRIALSAVVNGVLQQNFLVDTGASMLTIPYATATTLGLSFTNDGHGSQRMVSTAGGMVAAREVTIPSLEVGGWVEYNLRALVMDLPGQPGLGLLGLNYLSRFQMDLRNDQGILLLTPR